MHIAAACEHHDGARGLDNLIQAAARFDSFEVGRPIHLYPSAPVRD
jgi:hypothetical protein